MTDIDWQRSLVMLITPDAFVRGLGRRILDDVRGEGFVPTAARVVQPGTTVLDALYEDVMANNGTFGTYRYRCVDELFGLGSSLAVTIEPLDQARHPDPHAFMQSYKGTGPLERADPACLRKRYGSVNSILSLVHTSATPKEAALDFNIYFARDWLSRPDTAVPAGPGEVPDLPPELATDLLDATNADRRDFDTVLNHVRARAVAHAWELFEPEFQAAFARRRTERGEDALLDDALLAEGAAALPTGVDPALTQLLAHPFTPVAAPVDTRRLWRALEGAGVHIDRWERAVLATSQYFAPERGDEVRP